MEAVRSPDGRRRLLGRGDLRPGRGDSDSSRAPCPAERSSSRRRRSRSWSGARRGCGAAKVPIVPEEVARVNGIEIAYERMGDPADPPLLLVMGLGMQLIHWDRESVRHARRPRLPRDPLRQPRRRPLDQDRRAGAPTSAARCSACTSRALPARRHGRRRRRAARPPRHPGRPRRRGVDGRHDRPDAGDPAPGAGASPDVDHVDHRESGAGPPEAARVERPGAPRPAAEGRLHRPFRARVQDDRVARVRVRRGAHPRRWPPRPTSATTTPRAPAASWRRSWRRAIAPPSCTRSGCRPP